MLEDTNVKNLLSIQTRISEMIQEAPLAARCYHVANNLTNFIGDKLMNDKNRQTDGQHHCTIKHLHLRVGTY